MCFLFYSILLFSLLCVIRQQQQQRLLCFWKGKILRKKTIENANNNNNKFYIYVYVYMCLFRVFGRRMCFFRSLEYGHNDDKSKKCRSTKSKSKTKTGLLFILYCFYYIARVYIFFVSFIIINLAIEKNVKNCFYFWASKAIL